MSQTPPRETKQMLQSGRESWSLFAPKLSRSRTDRRGGGRLLPFPPLPTPHPQQGTGARGLCGQEQAGVGSWIRPQCRPEKGPCPTSCPQWPKQLGTGAHSWTGAPSRVPFPLRTIGAPASGSWGAGGGSLPALGSQRPHPGQGLLLLGAQVPHSAAHGAFCCSGCSLAPGFAPEVRCWSRPRRESPGPPRPIPPLVSPPFWGVCHHLSPRCTLAGPGGNPPPKGPQSRLQ